MNEKTRVKIIGAILVCSLVWAGFNFNSGQKSTVPEAPQTKQPIETAQNVARANTNFIDIKKFESESWGRSPFYLSSLATKELPTSMVQPGNVLAWTLSGIIYNNTSPTAIINKQPVKTGELVDKAVVTSIEKDKVTIQYNNKEILLKVSKG